MKRYAADARAADYVARFYTPTGEITGPMLHLHTTYDPLVPASVPNSYAGVAEQAGRGALFAQQFVKRDRHCTMSRAEIRTGFTRPPADAAPVQTTAP